MLRHVIIACALTLPVLASGCMIQQGDEYREAVPTSSELSVAIPGEGDSTPGAARGALIGERAPFYQITRDTSRVINGGLWVVGQIVEAIVRHRPTEVDGNHAVWGPWNETLSPITYVFEVERIGEGRFRYVLRGKPRAELDDAYVDLVGGETEIDHAAGVRRGWIGLDFDAANALDAGEHRETGRVLAHWDAGANPRLVEAAFEDFANARGEGPVSALYRYKENHDGSGSFEFGFVADTDDPGTLAEEVVLMTRWDATGAGRGDALITGGDAGGVVIYANECWDDGFGRTFWYDNAGFIATEGDPAACVYSEPLWSDMAM
jgi:hypothetical protein